MSNEPSNSQSSPPPRAPLRRGGGPGNPGKIEKAKDSRQALVRLLPYLKPYAASLILVLAFVVIYTLLSLIGPYLMGVAIDTAIIPGDVPRLIRLALLMLISYFFYSAFQALADWMMARVSQSALKQMRRDLFEHLQALSLRFFDRNPAGELMSRLTNDIDAINQAVSQNVTSIIASILTLVGILIAMFVLNYWLALASLLVVPIMVWFTSFVAKYTRRGFRSLQKDLGELNATLEETISGQRVVKAFRRSDTAIDKFRQYNQAVYQSGLYANSYALLLMPLTNVLGNFFVIVLAGFGGWLALQGLTTIGMIATLSATGGSSSTHCARWPICTTPSRPPWPGLSASLKSWIRPSNCKMPPMPPRSKRSMDTCSFRM